MESTLSLTYDQLKIEVQIFLGYPAGFTGDPDLSDFQTNRVKSCLASGLRNFFFPTPVQNGPIYDWSFMRPTATTALLEGSVGAVLPDDFGGFEGSMTLLRPTGALWHPISLVNEGQVREAYTRSPSRTGRPEIAALAPLKGTQATSGTRWSLIYFPKLDQDYTVQFQYYVLDDFLDGSLPFPMGGMAHAETILESCLAVAEQRQDNKMGVHTANFEKRLLASIAADRRNKAQTLGYNGDRSDYGRHRSDFGYGRITYKGQNYGA